MNDDDTDHGWTIAGLRRVIFALLEERDRRYQQRFDAQEEAIRKAHDRRGDTFAVWALIISVGTLLVMIAPIFLHR